LEQAEAILAECRRQRTRALRWAAVTAALFIVLLVATVVAAVNGRYHGPLVFLVPVLLLMNAMRLGQYLMALRKIRHAERLVRDAQALYSGAEGSQHPLREADRPSREFAREPVTALTLQVPPGPRSCGTRSWR
jgi:hypothetical protein